MKTDIEFIIHVASRIDQDEFRVDLRKYESTFIRINLLNGLSFSHK